MCKGALCDGAGDGAGLAGTDAWAMTQAHALSFVHCGPAAAAAVASVTAAAIAAAGEHWASINNDPSQQARHAYTIAVPANIPSAAR